MDTIVTLLTLYAVWNSNSVEYFVILTLTGKFTFFNIDIRIQKVTESIVLFPNPTATGWALESGSSINFDTSSLPGK